MHVSTTPVASRDGDATKPARNKNFYLMVILILLASGAVYGNALFNGFVHDDVPQVVNNTWIRDFRYIPQIFGANVWEFMGKVTTNYYRPLMHVMYTIDFHVFGLEPWGFHLVNILWHGGVSVLVFLVTERLLAKDNPLPRISPNLSAFAVALLFAVNPVHTEAVTWIAGFPELSFSLFYLLSVYYYIRADEGKRGCATLSVAAFACATLCKETALTLPMILFAYDITFRRTRGGIADHLRRWLPFVLVAGVYLALRVHVLKGFAPDIRHPELNAYEYVINVFPLFAQYLGKLLYPFDLNAFHVLHPIKSIFSPKGMISLAIAAAFIVGAGVAFKKSKVVFFGCVVAVVPLLPVFYIPGLGENTFAERYLYLPSFGFILLTVLGIIWIMQRCNAVKAAAAALTVVTVAYAAATVDRNAVWKNNMTFWTDAVAKSPDGAIPHYNLGNNLTSQGRIDEAIEQYRMAISLKPSVDEHYNLGRAYEMKGLAALAIEQYGQAVLLNPSNADSYTHLGFNYAMMGQLDKAVENLEMAIKLNPSDSLARSNLAWVMGMKSGAAKSGGGRMKH